MKRGIFDGMNGTSKSRKNQKDQRKRKLKNTWEYWTQTGQKKFDDERKN